MRVLCLALLLVLQLQPAAAADEQKPVWLVVGPKHLLEPLKPLVELRARQGLRPVLETGRVDLVLKRHDPAYLLIVGDHGDPQARWHVAARTETFYRWRKVQPPTFATDALWTECPVGRIPARTQKQVAACVEKIVRYETRPPRLSDLRLLGWAGAPGYGGAVDSLATGMFVKTVRDHAPKWADAWLLSGDANADLCGWPPGQPLRFAQEMARGSFLTALAAHASHAAVFSMKFRGRGIWFTGREIAATEPAAPMILLACNCGEFDKDKVSIAERLLFHPGGPVAVVGATTESHPLTNFYTGVALLKVAKSAGVGTDGDALSLGSFWKRTEALADKTHIPMIEFALKDVEGKLEPRIDVKKLRRDQKRIYALLGDPASRLRMPRKLQATVEHRDGAWHWKAVKPEGATAFHVGVRPDGGGFEQPAEPDGEAGRIARLEGANAAHAYRRVPDAGWTGSAQGRGALRLVAVTPSALHVATFER